MALLEITLQNQTTYSFVAGAAETEVSLLGGGGGGGNGGALQRGGGGGGGAYASSVLPLAPGETYSLVIGGGGAATAAGTPSTFSSTAAGFSGKAFTIPVTGGGNWNQAAAATLIMTPTTPGANPISFVGAVGATGVGGSNQTAEPALPTGLQAGDVVIAAYYAGAADATIPEGWTVAVQLQNIYYVLYHIVQSSAESGTVVGLSSGSVFGLSYTAWRGVASVTVGETGTGNSTGGAPSLAISATVTAPQGTTRVLAVAARSSSTTILQWDTPAGMTERYDTTNLASAGRSVYQASELYTAISGSTLVQAAAGSPGANQSGLSAGAGGAGGTVANSIGTTRTAGSAGATGGNGGNGASPLGGAGNLYGDGGAGGQALSAPGSPGNAGRALVKYSTGVGVIEHQSTISKLSTLTRLSSGSITHTAMFNRAVTIQRAFLAGITHVSSVSKQIALLRIASILHVAGQTRKAVTLNRIAEIVHVSSVNKTIVLSIRAAQITHQAIFTRSVTIRRSFVAGITHVGKIYTYLEARLIPRGEGGIIVNVIRRILNIVIDD